MRVSLSSTPGSQPRFHFSPTFPQPHPQRGRYSQWECNMPAVQPVQPVPAVQPVAGRAPTWFAAPTGKAPAAVTFDDVLAACLGRPGIPADSASDSSPDMATPPFLFER